jgi:hypothetical protein
MKIRAKTTYYIIATAVVYLLLVAFVDWLKIFDNMPMTYIQRWILNVVMEITYVTVMLYLYQALRYVNENRHITIPFLIYIGYDLFIFVLRLLARSPMNGLFILLGGITVVITLYFTIQLFSVRNKALTFSFKLLAITMLFSVLLRSIGSILAILHWVSHSIFIYIILSELLPPTASILLLCKILTYLNKEQHAFKLAASKADEPA